MIRLAAFFLGLALAVAWAPVAFADHGSPFGFVEGGLGPGWWFVLLMAPVPFLVVGVIALALRRAARGDRR